MTDADVLVVGAGLAGLSAARTLSRAGVAVRVLEAGDAIGGRVRTDQQDGLLLDRGFQLLNPSYPAVRRLVDVDALRLHPFRAGLLVARGDVRLLVGDPRRWPRAAVTALRAPIGSPAEKFNFARWCAELGLLPAARITRPPDRALSEILRDRHLDGAIDECVIRPFLAGVLGEDELASSGRFAQLLVRSFVRGTPSLPHRGMRALPEQLAGGLDVALGCAARATTATTVATDDRELRADAVIVATDPRTAATLAGTAVPRLYGLTTFYHRADAAPVADAVLLVDADHRGPIVNSAVVSNAAASYAASGALIASTVLGADGSSAAESIVRTQLAAMYGADTRAWEHVATYAIADALPAVAPGTPLRRPVRLDNGIFVAGDHRDTSSIQGALVSGERAANAVLARLGKAARTG